MNSKVTDITLNSSQEYTSKDIDLINFVELKRRFGLPEDYIELHIYDLNNNLIKSNYNYLGYRSLLSSLPSPTNLIDTLNIDPNQDSINEGYNYGSNILSYNIFRKLFGSSVNNKFFIKTISTDRTELRISNNNLSNDDLQTFYTNFIVSSTQEAFYKDFYLNFGENSILIGINVVLEQDITQFNLLVKLYEPLPNNFSTKDQFWIIDKLSDPISYQIDFEVVQNTSSSLDINQLRGPNFNIKINNEINPSINYVNYNSFFSTTSTSSYQQLKSILEEKSLDINIDYTDYSNFIHFSSAKERLLNFIYKLKLIEAYKGDLKTLNSSTSTPQVSSSKAVITNNINNIIEKFDGYEYYLYYNSGSKAFPKKSSIIPYVNFETTSSAALVWLGDDNSKAGLYGGQIYSASYFDDNNQDNLLYLIPEYLRIDPQNHGYELFVHMIGQHFDNIWLYAKDLTDLYNAENNVDKGISKDLVSYALKSLGIKLYSNTNSTSDIFAYLLGITPSGSLLPSTGSEVITSYVTMSLSSSTLPGSDIDKEIYKRIYHNLPYLLKTKGTERGLRALITCYGIPDTILHINEFGGTDKTAANFEQYYDRTSYALNTKTGSVYITTPWAPVYVQSLSQSNINAVPDTIEFRFKTNGPLTGSSQKTLFTSQSLFQVGSGSATQFGVQLLYTSQSNSGAFGNYGDIRLLISGSGNYSSSLPIHLPFFNDDWWNVMVYRETGSLPSSSISNANKYWIYAANSIYNGHDGETVGYIGSSSIIISSSTPTFNRAWNLYDTSSFTSYLGGAGSNNVIGSGSTRFNGFFQELRYWINPLPVDNFKAHTLNPLSIENTDVTSSYSKLIFRLPLGTDLSVTGSSIVYSVHPFYTGSVVGSGSFLIAGNQISYGNIISPGLSLYGVAIYGQDIYFGSGTDIVYTSNTSFYYLKSGNMGLSKPTNDKIRIDSQEITSGSTLSPSTRLEQKHQIALTNDINTLEVAFSPQDQINNDIIYQLGYFDIDEYIGDPREGTGSIYESLKSLRDFYFKKYISSYNIFDFVRLIKYYNNSLFKMIKDFVPARSNVSTGIIIKPHILERNKHKRFEPIFSYNQYSGSLQVEKFSGSDGRFFAKQTSSFVEIIRSPLGNINLSHNDNFEFYNGKLKGSNILVTDQSLQNNPYILNSSSYDQNIFNHSIFNTLLNNISQSRKSSTRYKVNYNTNQNIASNINVIVSQSFYDLSEVQDTNYKIQSYILPRYLGSKTTSQLYNIFTDGDKSYGKTAAVDLNTKKIGLFIAITESRFIPNKQETRLKYLVDESGSLTELNLLNNNWFEVQNIFKANNNSVVALFDTHKFGNQKSTDGEKLIYKSGYDYQPMLYYSQSDNSLSFLLNENPNADLFKYNTIDGGYTNFTSSGTDPDTAILTFANFAHNKFGFSLNKAIYSQDIRITSASVTGWLNSDCTGLYGYSHLNMAVSGSGSSLVINRGNLTGEALGTANFFSCPDGYNKNNGIMISGSSPSGKLNGASTFTLPGSSTVFTLSIVTTCNTYPC